jgi:hypothetical protein
VHEETELLVNAIEALKQEPNYIKDYIFPIASALFTSVLGAGIAFFTLCSGCLKATDVNN